MTSGLLDRETRAVYSGPVSVSIEFIGPNEAAQMLAMNQRNRAIRPGRAKTIAADMRADRWHLNGETIKVTRGGLLADGQHRLTGVVESGKGQWMVVVRGLSEDAQESIDRGAPRTFGDALAMRGEENARSLSGALVIAWTLETYGSPAVSGAADRPAPSNDALSDYLDDNPDIRQSVIIGEALHRSDVRLVTAHASALHFLMSRRDAALAGDFFGLLASGENLAEGHPVFALRRVLLLDLGARRHIPVVAKSAIIVKAWNALREGRSLVRVQVPARGGKKREPFPTIK